jgi:endonuclease III-like uncharacterized protein
MEEASTLSRLLTNLNKTDWTSIKKTQEKIEELKINIIGKIRQVSQVETKESKLTLESLNFTYRQSNKALKEIKKLEKKIIDTDRSLDFGAAA